MDRPPESCNDVLAELPLFVGGDLEAPGMTAIALHLADCRGCRAAAGRAAEARSLLGELRERTGAPPADLWPKLRQRLSAEGILAPAEGAAARSLHETAVRSATAEGPAVGVRAAARPRLRLLEGRWASGGLAAAAAAVLCLGVGRWLLLPGEAPARGGADVVLEPSVGAPLPGPPVPAWPAGGGVTTVSVPFPVGHTMPVGEQAGAAPVAPAQDGRLRRATEADPWMLREAHQQPVLYVPRVIARPGSGSILTGSDR